MYHEFWLNHVARARGTKGGHNLPCDGSCEWQAISGALTGAAQLRYKHNYKRWNKHLYSTIHHYSNHVWPDTPVLWSTHAVSLEAVHGLTCYQVFFILPNAATSVNKQCSIFVSAVPTWRDFITKWDLVIESFCILIIHIYVSLRWCIVFKQCLDTMFWLASL